MQATQVEAINRIAELGVQVKVPRLLAAPGEPDGRYYKCTPEEMELVDPQVKSRSHAATDLETLIRYAVASGDKAVIWCDREEVVLVMDDASNRRDTLTLKLACSDHMGTIVSEEFGNPRNQRDMIRFIRIDLDGAMGPDSKLLHLLGKVKFNQSDSGTAEVRVGRESVDRATKAELTGHDAIPEVVTLFLSIFENRDVAFPIQIRCAMDIYPQDACMKLVALPGEVQKAINDTMDHLVNRISKGVKCPVYRGRP